MKIPWFSFYNLVLALWVGGITIFTFIVTPVIFKSFAKDMAGAIVGKVFPRYFLYNLVLSALAVILFFLLKVEKSTLPYRISLFLLFAALIINVFIVFKLHPQIVQVKQQVSSFETESSDSPVLKKFRRLHGVSATLNLFLLVDGITLLTASSFLKK